MKIFLSIIKIKAKHCCKLNYFQASCPIQTAPPILPLVAPVFSEEKLFSSRQRNTANNAN
jgi:hypothetical protein